MARAPDVEDAVDRILDQWRCERPDVDVSAMGVVGRISRLSRLFERSIKNTLAGLELEPTGFDVLATLRRSGSPYSLSPTAIVSLLMLSSGAMTNRLDRVESEGLIERQPDPHDRRGLLIRLTPAGKKLIDRALGHHAANELELLSGLTAEERQTLERLLRKLLVGLEGSSAGVVDKPSRQGKVAKLSHRGTGS